MATTSKKNDPSHIDQNVYRYYTALQNADGDLPDIKDYEPFGAWQDFVVDITDVRAKKGAAELKKRIANLSKIRTDRNKQLLKVLSGALPSTEESSTQKLQMPETFRMRDIQDKTFPDLKWIIPDILPEGLTILAGKPKLGKSWLLLSMMCAVSAGGVTLGNVPVEHGTTLYIDLEDNERRLKSRANKVLDNYKASEDAHVTFKWPRLNQGGLEAIENWIVEHPGVRLIGIDTWAKIKPHQQGNRGQKLQYDEDYESLTPLQELAGKHSVAIVIVHHMRKEEAEDPLDGISGSTALQGAVDGFLLLYRKRGEDDARLFIDGRDIEEQQELILSFDHARASWNIKGDADELAATPERQAILDVLKPHPDGLTLKQIALELEKNPNTTRNLLVSLRNEGKITLKNNVYLPSNPSKPSKPSNP